MEVKMDSQELKKLSNILLNPSTTIGEIKKTINGINNAFKEIIEYTGEEVDLNYLAAMPSESGMALSMHHAAECLLDYKRTTKFLKGFIQCIKDKQEKYPEETINIFYAGCGPFAPFVTLVAPLFSPKQVQFSLLEINNKSIEAAKKLIKELELTAYVKEYYLADAITFKIPNPERVHILFSETLDALLNRECYVPILWNLLPQLPKEASVVPENVLIKLNFKLEGQKEEDETFGATVFDTREALVSVGKTEKLPKELPSTFVSLKEADPYFSVVLDTEVVIYKGYVLTRSESSLTLALEIPIHKPITHDGVVFTYVFDPQPSLQLKME